MSGSYIIASFSVVQSALLQRQMQFNKVAIITAVGIMTGGVAGIISAISHLGVWSLVIQYLITCLISTLLYIIVSKWKPGFHFRWGDIRQVWGFSAFLTGFNLSNYSARNADNLIVGRMLGATSLGAYALAYRMMVYPISNLTSVIQQAVLPLFSRVQDEKEKLSRSFIKSSRYQAFLITPLMLGLAVMANEFILVFFGERWAAAVPVLAILCLVAVFQPYVMYFTVVLISKGLTKVLFYWSLTTTVVLIIAFLVSVQWGIVGVAVAYLIIQVIIAVASIPILFRMAGISVRHFLQQMTLPFFASVCMAAVVAVIRFILVTRTDIGTASCLLVGVLGGMVIYGTILFLFRRAFWNEMKGDVSMLFGRKPKVMEK
jgi:O-antigen/teichoic acid export membrane protein